MLTHTRFLLQWRSTAHHDHQRCLSTMQVPQGEETWTHAQWAAAALPRLGPVVRQGLRARLHRGGRARSYRTRAGGTDVVTRHVARRGGETHVAHGLAGPVQ